MDAHSDVRGMRSSLHLVRKIRIIRQFGCAARDGMFVERIGSDILDSQVSFLISLFSFNSLIQNSEMVSTEILLKCSGNIFGTVWREGSPSLIEISTTRL